MMLTCSFYLVISFLIFLVLLYRYAYNPIVNFLDAQIRMIKTELDQAHHQKETARLALDKENQMAQALEEDVLAILKNAQDQCALLRQNIQTEIFEESIEQDHKVQEAIEKMQRDFVYYLRDGIADRIIQETKDWLKAHLDKKIQQEAYYKAINSLHNLQSARKSQD